MFEPHSPYAKTYKCSDLQNKFFTAVTQSCDFQCHECQYSVRRQLEQYNFLCRCAIYAGGGNVHRWESVQFAQSLFL